jgi:cytochrome c biogenesis protein CcmG, thiol:disulfide interchange protein DsbE
MRTTVFCAAFIFLTFNSLVAQPAPDFTLKDVGGKEVSLASFKGKIIVVDFWAMWCQACKEAFGHLNTIQKEYGEKGVVVIGVNLEKANPQKVEGFIKKAGIGYTVVLDPEAAAAKLYNVKGVPTLAVIGKDMQIVKTFRGMNKSTVKDLNDLLQKLSAQ